MAWKREEWKNYSFSFRISNDGLFFPSLRLRPRVLLRVKLVSACDLAKLILCYNRNGRDKQRSADVA